jgi:hypothetical protein
MAWVNETFLDLGAFDQLFARLFGTAASRNVATQILAHKPIS